jgi:hypothetical protein
LLSKGISPIFPKQDFDKARFGMRQKSSSLMMAHVFIFVGMNMDEFFHDDDVAKLFRMTVEGLRNKIDAGDPLPPYSNPPGLRVRLWPKDEVKEWVMKFVVGQSVVFDNQSEKRRGRPRKKGPAK